MEKYNTCSHGRYWPVFDEYWPVLTGIDRHWPVFNPVRDWSSFIPFRCRYEAFRPFRPGMEFITMGRREGAREKQGCVRAKERVMRAELSTPAHARCSNKVYTRYIDTVDRFHSPTTRLMDHILPLHSHSSTPTSSFGEACISYSCTRGSPGRRNACSVLWPSIRSRPLVWVHHIRWVDWTN
jgi:hypothetical protein